MSERDQLLRDIHACEQSASGAAHRVAAFASAKLDEPGDDGEKH